MGAISGRTDCGRLRWPSAPPSLPLTLTSVLGIDPSSSHVTHVASAVQTSALGVSLFFNLYHQSSSAPIRHKTRRSRFLARVWEWIFSLRVYPHFLFSPLKLFLPKSDKTSQSSPHQIISLSPKSSHLLPTQAQNSFLICFPIFHFTFFFRAVFSWDYSVITASFQATVLQLNCKLHSLCTVCIHQSIHLFIWEYVMIVVVFKSTVSNHKERAKEKLKFILRLASDFLWSYWELRSYEVIYWTITK